MVKMMMMMMMMFRVASIHLTEAYELSSKGERDGRDGGNFDFF